jgi:hypothetical protein
MLAAAARADNKRFFCCERDFKIVSPASSVSVAILCACSNVSERRSALETDVTSASRRSSSFKTAKEFLPEPPVVVAVVPDSMSRLESNCCLKGRRINRGKGQRCTKTSDKDDDEEKDHRTRAPEMPPQREREREREEREKKGKPPARGGGTKIFIPRALFSPKKQILARCKTTTRTTSIRKKEEEEEEDKNGKRRTGALSLDAVGICTMIFSFVFIVF